MAESFQRLQKMVLSILSLDTHYKREDLGIRICIGIMRLGEISCHVIFQ